MTSRSGAPSWARRRLLVCFGAALWSGAATLNARAAEPVKIGFSVSLTFYDPADINQAAADSANGTTI